ncbi:MAG TPA: universal stress protein [Dehalococcoidia bacterium]|nr:universal stress protein [Dehalococcoidia bacterium]
MYDKILVPLDGSELAENTVLPYVESVAGAFDSEIILTNVTGLAEIGLGRLYNTYLDGVAKQLEAKLEAMGKKPRVGWEVLTGKPAEEILKAADRNKANLIILSSAGGSGLDRWVLGAVATKLVRASSVPILLIKPRERVEAAKPFQSILVPLDGSPEAEVVLPHVVSLATKMGPGSPPSRRLTSPPWGPPNLPPIMRPWSKT